MHWDTLKLLVHQTDFLFWDIVCRYLEILNFYFFLSSIRLEFQKNTKIDLLTYLWTILKFKWSYQNSIKPQGKEYRSKWKWSIMLVYVPLLITCGDVIRDALCIEGLPKTLPFCQIHDHFFLWYYFVTTSIVFSMNFKMSNFCVATKIS